MQLLGFFGCGLRMTVMRDGTTYDTSAVTDYQEWLSRNERFLAAARNDNGSSSVSTERDLELPLLPRRLIPDTRTPGLSSNPGVWWRWGESNPRPEPLAGHVLHA